MKHHKHIPVIPLFFSVLFLFFSQRYAAQQLHFQSTSHYYPVKWMILQKLEGAEMFYVMALDSIPPEGGKFIAGGLPHGEYALQYDTQHLPGIRFIHTGEDVDIKFNPQNPLQIEVVQSKTNRIYYDYLLHSRQVIRKLIDFKREYEKNADPGLQTKYLEFKAEYDRHTDSILKAHQDEMLWHFIKARKRVLPDSLKKSRKEYVDYALQHYFDEIDLNDTVLYHSNVLFDRVQEYLFKIPIHGYGKEKSDAYIRRLKTVFDRLQYLPTRTSFLKTLLIMFAMEDDRVFDYLKKLYQSLPPGLNQNEFIEQISKNRFPVRGRKFDKTYLSNSTGIKFDPDANYTLIIFYSSDCPHCRKQIPMVYQMINEKYTGKLQVVAIGLEENPEQWKAFSKPFKNWKNAYVTGQKNTEMAMKYFVEYTPTYFLVNKNFEILEKTPETKKIQSILQYFLNHE